MLVPRFYARPAAPRIRVSPIYFPGQNPLDHACRWNSSTVEDGGKGTCEISQRRPDAMPKHVAIYGVDVYGDPNAVYGKTPGPVEETNMSMNSNRISIDLTGPPLTSINGALDTLDSSPAFQLTLTPEEKNSMARAAEKRAGFLEKAISYMGSAPQFIPGYINMVEVNKDIVARGQFLQFLLRLRVLAAKGEDTLMVINSEIYRAALAYYESVERGANMGIPGAQAIYDDLKKEFPGRGSGETPPSPTPTP